MASLPTLKLTIFSDYICPFCYIGNARLDSLRSDYDVRINWVHLELHPETPVKGMAAEGLGYSDERWANMTSSLTRLAAEENLPLVPQEATTNSHQALLLSEAAKKDGRELFYRLHNALFHAWFAEGRNIGETRELEKIARECAIPKATMDRAWGDPCYENQVLENRKLAIRSGVSAVPTFVFGAEKLSGVVSRDALNQAARALLQGH